MTRIKQLDSVRALAILAVFFHHALKIKLLWMGVDLFFVLSGFLITGVLLNEKHRGIGKYFSHFYERRVRRILPPYGLTLVLASLFFGIAWMRHWYLYILLTNFLLPLHIQHPIAFDPLWSLAVEEQFYLVWPFAVYYLSERHLRALFDFFHCNGPGASRRHALSAALAHLHTHALSHGPAGSRRAALSGVETESLWN